MPEQQAFCRSQNQSLIEFFAQLTQAHGDIRHAHHVHPQYGRPQPPPLSVLDIALSDPPRALGTPQQILRTCGHVRLAVVPDPLRVHVPDLSRHAHLRRRLRRGSPRNHHARRYCNVEELGAAPAPDDRIRGYTRLPYLQALRLLRE
ncbi:hypothetical protein BC936DRAFT_142143 [Jimgerdemannia flammicorona]|uniref:Uncharacterized protein n=1 Tax=Jimgerdemannia flammicorona TaxID=994334 RepID=A0A433A0V0_9FUNG|nr:hypothetical protein BC936DRAFT_142143 [Jimgerdemannia flammicorona]